jgi:hypothetical protein
MDGQALRIRPSEKLYLYERLVLCRQSKEVTCRRAITRLRENCGEDFLAEVVEHCPARGTEGALRREGYMRVLQNYMEKDGRMAHEQGGYSFDFLNGVYTWNGEVLHITPVEAVFLYERAVLRLQEKKGSYRHTYPSVLQQMRKRFGGRFLAELFPLRKRKNRR